jgi:hemolysin activation/secretion protein
VPLRAHQTELRLQRARQLLADADAKIINVAYNSGYRHLGLFNAMFKKRFGLTPSEWRRQNLPVPPKNEFRRVRLVPALLLWATARFLLSTSVLPAQTTNTLLTSAQMDLALTNTPGAVGTNVTFTAIRAALGNLQMAYRERGFVTVSVSLPPQKLTNGVVQVRVIEGRLASIKVQGNDYFSTPNVLRALPGLNTNQLLNSHVFQHELDLANANRNRQIYPVISPGPEPGTSELILKVKDRLPLHARVEINNQATPGTPDSRVNFNAQYDNLWQLEHQIGVSYSFTPVNFHEPGDFNFSPFDDPLIANYSVYYRLPLGPAESVQEQIDASHGQFGYDEVTHRFNMPPSSGRPELTFYASRSVSDTGVQKGPNGVLAASSMLTNSTGTPYTPVQITTNSAGQNVTLNEGLGTKLSLPLPPVEDITTLLFLGADFKRYQEVSCNTNENYFILQTPDTGVAGGIATTTTAEPQAQKTRYTGVDYFPVNAGFSASRPDPWGTTTLNAQANFNLATISEYSHSGTNHSHGGMSDIAYSSKAENHYLTLQSGLSREQRLYKDWTVLFRADGQWADTPVISNEQFGMGGVAGVRGYTDGECYGDTGWRVAVEPRTPMVNLGMVDGDIPFWMRASVFMDYGETYLLEKVSATSQDAAQFWGCGASLTANIGSHLDARLTVAWPLLTTELTPAGDFHFYFGVGAQF